MGSSYINIAMIIALLLGTGLLLLGFWLLWRWRRATRIGQHPTCRACGFDLRGLQTQAIGTQDISPCPECGKPLTQDNIATGDSRRSPFTLAIAVACLLIATGIFGLTLRGIWPTLTNRLPTSILVIQSTLDRNDSIGTITELASRIGTKRISTAQTHTLIERALDQQKTALIWIPVWGSIVENAHAAGLTSDAQWNSYIRTAATPFVDVSSKVAQGDPLSLDIGIKNCRVSASASNTTIVGMSVMAQINGAELLQPKLGGGSFGLSANVASWSTYTGDTSPVTPGEHMLIVKVTASMRDAQDPYAKPPRTTFDYTITRPITVLPQGTGTHVLKTDSHLQEAVRKSISIQHFQLIDSHMIGLVRSDFMVHAENLPVGLGMEMFLSVRQPDGTQIERRVGSVACGPLPKGGKHGLGTGADLKDANPLIDALLSTGGEGDIVFRPSLDVARTRPNLYEIWGEDIVIPSQNIKINLRERPEALSTNLEKGQSPSK